MSEDHDHAEQFSVMAEKISRNIGNGFAGAFVIVSPSGDTQAMLFLDAKPDEAMFWSAVNTKAQIALREIEEAQRQGTAFGRR